MRRGSICVTAAIESTLMEIETSLDNKLPQSVQLGALAESDNSTLTITNNNNNNNNNNG